METPRIRPVDAQPFEQDGRPMLFLRDPLALSDRLIAAPQTLGPALALADGTRDLYAIQAALVARFGISVRIRTLEQLFAALDEACLLDNARSAAAKQAALAAYRSAPCRPPALADQGYPATPAELKAALDALLAAAPPASIGVTAGAAVRGIVSPHIDYARGGPIYAAVWGHADVAAAVRRAERVIVLGTDHSGGFGKLTLTRQAYATPYGVLPAPDALVSELADALGEETAFEEELHHRNEHSIELAATWLHHMRDGASVEMLPILCGSFHPFSHGEAAPATFGPFAGAVTVLRRAIADRPTLVVAAADLAHIGPAFGGEPVAGVGQAQLRRADAALLEHMQAGDAEGFFGALAAVQDRNNVCGLPPIYLALRLLAPVAGQTIAYDQCHADDADASWVSVAGLAWR